MGSDGLRGELTLVRTARALAAFNGKERVDLGNIKQIASMALSHRLEETRLMTQAQEQGSRDQFKNIRIKMPEVNMDSAKLAEIALSLCSSAPHDFGGIVFKNASETHTSHIKPI